MIGQNLKTAEQLLEAGNFQECMQLLTSLREELETRMKKRGMEFTWENEAQVLRDIGHMDEQALRTKDTLDNIELVMYYDNGSELGDLAQAMYTDFLGDWTHYCNAMDSAH